MICGAERTLTLVTEASAESAKLGILLRMKYLTYAVISDFDHVLTRMKWEAIPARLRNIGSKDDKIRWDKEIRIGRLKVKDRMPSYLRNRC